jgi:hypothetical protein
MSEVTTPSLPVEQEQSWIAQKLEMTRQNAKRILAIGAIGIAGVSGAYMLGKNGSPHESAATAADVAQNGNPNCDDLTLENVAASYGTGKFLPAAKGGIHNANEAASYTKSLFDKNGPLSGTADRASLAVIAAAVSDAALEKQSTNNSYNYNFQFDQHVGMNKNEAEKLCKDEYRVLGETVGYDDNAIASGQQYTAFTAVKKDGQVVDLRLEHKTADKGDIEGITYAPQNTKNKDQLNGFNKVIVQEDGEIDVVGWLPTSAKKVSKHEAPAGHKRSHHKAPAGHNPSNEHAPAGSNQKRQNVNGGGHSGSGVNQKGIKRGPSPERNAGPAPGNRNHGPSKQGPTPHAAPGPHPTPGPGAGGPVPSPESQPGPAPAPSPSPSPETTPTPTPTGTTPTPTPSGGKGSEPTCTPSEYTPCS